MAIKARFGEKSITLLFANILYMLKYLNMLKNKKLWIISALVVVMALSVFFRVWDLNSVPPGLYPDVAMNGNDALNTLENRDFKVFYPDNNGREGLFMWLIALSFSIFGASVWSMKIVASLFGIFTVLGVYLLSKELFKKINQNYELIAILSSFFIAVSFWHTLFSRLGFRAIMVPFFLVYGFYFLIKGFDKGKGVFNFITSGIFLGLGFYSYISYRFVVLLGIIVFFLWRRNKEFFKGAAICSASMIITALPLGIYFLSHPQDFFGRAAGVSVLNDQNPLFSLLKSVVLHLGMFNFYGDGNWRHNYSGSPELFLPVGIFFLIGFILSIREIIRRRNIAVYVFLISWFFIMLLSCFLSGEGAPHALRAIGAIPVVYIFAGLGAFFIFDKLKGFFHTKIGLYQFYTVIAILLLIIAFFDFYKYFYSWGRNQNVNDAYSKNYVDMANQLNTAPDGIEKYVVVNQSGVLANEIPVPAQTPIFIERSVYGKTRAKYILPENISKISPQNEALIFLMAEDLDLSAKIMSLFPNGDFYNFEGFWVYKINKVPPVALPESSCNCGQN